MKNEINPNASEILFMAALLKVAGQISGVELISVQSTTGEDDEGEDGTVRTFLLKERCATKSVPEISLRGTVRMIRDKNKPWDTCLITGSVYANPDHPVNFRVKNGVVTAE